MKIKESIPIWVLWGFGIFFLGCSTKIREKKAADTDPGNAAYPKFDGQTMKVARNF